jgi:hypothetical protein
MRVLEATRVEQPFVHLGNPEELGVYPSSGERSTHRHGWHERHLQGPARTKSERDAEAAGLLIEGFDGFFQLLTEKSRAARADCWRNRNDDARGDDAGVAAPYWPRAYRRPSNNCDLCPDNSRSDIAPIFVGRRSS